MIALMAPIRAELTKIVTLRSVWLVFAAVLGLQILVDAQALSLYADAVSKITEDGMIEIFVGQPEPAEAAMIDGLVASSLEMSVFLPSLAAVMAGQEFRGRQFGLSVLAVPRRGRLIAAKLAAAAVFLLLAALSIVAVSTTFTYLAVKDWDPGLLLTAEAVLGQTKFVAFSVLFCLAVYAITLITRSTLVAILVSVALVAVSMAQAFANVPGVDALLPVSARTQPVAGSADE